MAQMGTSAKACRFIQKVNRHKRKNAHRGEAQVAQTLRRRCLVCNEPMPMGWMDSICARCTEQGRSYECLAPITGGETE